MLSGTVETSIRVLAAFKAATILFAILSIDQRVPMSVFEYFEDQDPLLRENPNSDNDSFSESRQEPRSAKSRDRQAEDSSTDPRRFDVRVSNAEAT